MDKAIKPEAATAPPAPVEVTDFEHAIGACKFGRFNVLLLLVCVPAMGATILETSSMSYVLPAAECDLELSLMDKGLINGITYAGMILSAIPWGFIADTTGRKRALVYGLLLDGVCVLGAALSQNLTQLLVCKFLGGFVSCGPFAVIMSYISELHSKQHRSRVMMVAGMIKNAVLLLLPALALAILPYRMDLNLFGLNLHNWNIFIAMTALPSLLSATLISLFPESPKFLMTQGRNAEALQVFQMIYAMNTGHDRSSYPVKALFEEAPARQPTVGEAAMQSPEGMHRTAHVSFNDGLKQLKPMFSHPYLRLSLLVYTLHFCILMGQNSVRLWLPQIFASIEEFELLQAGAASMCNILAYNVNKTRLVRDGDHLAAAATATECVVHVASTAYVNNVIAAAAGFAGAVLAIFLVNKVGNKFILCFGIGASFVLGSSFYFSTSALSTVIISSLFVTLSSLAITTVISASVNIFPTVMRTMVVVLVMTFGRVGALLGNVLFPVFISIGCIPPFLMVGGVMLVAFFLSLFLPDTRKQELK